MAPPAPLTEQELEQARERRRYQDIEDGIYAELRRFMSTIQRRSGDATHDRAPAGT